MKAAQLFDLSGQVALVTGGSAGIGFDIAQGLGDMGACVAIVARKADRLAEAEAMLRSRGIDAHAFVGDVSDTDGVGALVDRVLDRVGDIDILVNNAGTNWIAPAEDYPDTGWAKVMGLCIDGPFRLTREIGRRVMIPRRAGRIINIGSLAGDRGNGTGKPGGGHFIGYHAAKGALHSFTRALAVEWGPFNITVNCISPGFIATKAAGAFQESVKADAIGHTPLGRFGSGDDIRGAAIFLAARAGAFVTGQTLTVDGGLAVN